MNKIAIIGAAGRVGLPFTLALAKGAHNHNTRHNKRIYEIIGIDLNAQKCNDLMSGKFPYIEKHGQEYLEFCRKENVINFTTDLSHIKDSNFIFVMIGTPMDEESNPNLDDLFSLFDNHIIPTIDDDKQLKTIVLRSTVAPGTTRILNDRIIKQSKSNNFKLYFCPERVSQGFAIEEMVYSSPNIPNIIGVSDLYSNNVIYDSNIIKSIFTLITINATFETLSWEEAEIGKLITNMTRYVNFALSNSYYMIADKFPGVNINRVIDACNRNYPRLNLPKPGFASGPCLTKDGKYLSSGIPYADLINTSFLINEGFVNYIVDKIITEYKPDSNDIIGILGMTFKANNDDVRLSLSFKILKALRMKGFEVICHDPLWETSDMRNDTFKNVMDKSKIVIIATNHDSFKVDIEQYLKDNTHIQINQTNSNGKQSYNKPSKLRDIGIVDVWRLVDNINDDGFGIAYVKDNS